MSPLIATASPVALRPAAGLPAFALLISCWKRAFDCCVWAKQPRAGDTQRRARIAVLIVCMIASFCSCCFFGNKSTKNIRVTTRSHPLFCKSKGSDGQNKQKAKARQAKGKARQAKGSCRPAVALLQLLQICGKNFWGIFAPASRHPAITTQPSPPHAPASCHPAVTAPTCPLRWQ